MEILLLWIFYILTFYAFLPGLISRLFGFRVFRRGIAEREIALTFDDGPDPIYTAKLLDLLKTYKAKATFFVVGVHAEQNPELIKRMHEEGHLIGIHNYVHKSNWLMRPKTVKRHIHKTSGMIEEITGKPAVYYRPPWGIVNLFDFGNLGHIQIILWSAMFGDWRKRLGAERLYKRMKKTLKGGEVLLLHDCGLTFGADRDAPEQMLSALERYLKDAEAKELRCVRIDELIRTTENYKALHPSLIKRLTVKLWLGYEKLFHVVFGLKTASEAKPVLHFRARPYHGETMVLDDGVTLQHDDQVLELHFDNQHLYDIGHSSKSSVHLAIKLIRDVEKALPEIAAYVAERPELQQIKALYGVSFIHRGPEQFGFTVRDLPKGLFSWMTKRYLKLLLRVIHPMGQNRLRQQSDQLVPKTITMSMEYLMKRYGPGYHFSAHEMEASIHGAEQPFKNASL